MLKPENPWEMNSNRRRNLLRIFMKCKNTNVEFLHNILKMRVMFLKTQVEIDAPRLQ